MALVLVAKGLESLSIRYDRGAAVGAIGHELRGGREEVISTVELVWSI